MKQEKYKGGVFLAYLLLIVGFVLLIKGADIFVDGSISVARKLNIPSLIIGLTIVAMGTSAPEAAVSISASIKHANEIAVGNIIGSNIFNLLVVVGACAAIRPVHVKKSFLKADYPIGIFAAVILLALAFGNIFAKNVMLTRDVGSLSRIDGIILLVLMVMFIAYTIIKAKRSNEEQDEEFAAMGTMKTILFILIGIAGVIFGGQLVVDSAKTIALSFGLSDSLIGLTIVAIGTSLPELVTSVVAARKGESDIALGNVIGSNVFNTFFILGMTAVIGTVPVKGFTVIDAFIALCVTLAVFFMSMSKNRLNRVEGIAMIMMYALFTAYLIWRQTVFGI